MKTFATLDNRYVLTCVLESETGLHIGTGVASHETDAPIATQSGKPFLPGSSLRGALRSTVERIVQVLRPPGIQPCVLFEKPEETEAGKRCWAGNDDLRKQFEQATAADQSRMVRDGTLQLCPICRLFGSTLMSSKLSIRDAIIDGSWERPVRRDGVGINRDTEVAEPHIKYDFEVLGSGVRFKTVITLENAESSDFALLYILLEEWKRGIEFGGKRSRGLGRVTLGTPYDVQYFDPAMGHDLKAFIGSGLKKMDSDQIEYFQLVLQDHFESFTRRN